MASIHKEITVHAPSDHVWAAIRDVGGVHTRLAQEFVVDTRLEADSRLVTFANGVYARPRIAILSTGNEIVEPAAARAGTDLRHQSVHAVRRSRDSLLRRAGTELST